MVLTKAEIKILSKHTIKTNKNHRLRILKIKSISVEGQNTSTHNYEIIRTVKSTNDRQISNNSNKNTILA